MEKMNEKDQLYLLVKLFIQNKYSIDDFCKNFEKIYNLELDKKTLTKKEFEILDKLFHVVVYYNPSQDERKNWPGFKNEDGVTIAIKEAAKNLNIKGD